MIEIKPMDEDFLLPRCLHHGPIEVAAAAGSEEGDLRRILGATRRSAILSLDTPTASSSATRVRDGQRSSCGR